jgi:uncharacterized SAM-binding protein YcdF (DUF218 family)
VIGFLYSTFLKLLYPTSIALFFLIGAVLFRRRRVLARLCLGLGLAVLAVCGNGWVVHAMVRSLEWAHLPPDPVPNADAILVLSGGIHARSAPRPTVEVSEAGDRVLYGAELFRRGHAPQIVCTGDVGPGTIGRRPEAEDMADLMVMVGVPRSAIMLETKARNTHDHAVNLCPMFAERQIRRVLLVTSAIHMRRSLGVFRHSCPTVEYIPAPTDFRAIQRVPAPWYRVLAGFIPTPYNMVDFTDATHEYLGMLYYRLRGWL